ncbi:hypothetical protein MPNT_90091 [Candidatus Methylacidithermus pantelleriae]|uniref:Uncharacterized protein n=1 Tax=Candidatus Methylacidithermus pantelleriae TaxID=2744239 RepID=A0A8J2BT55_9BACT|nr:hypothetical protein MPNT_90091 [Candidatus Methylacidithermus pantelleriae]
MERVFAAAFKGAWEGRQVRLLAGCVLKDRWVAAVERFFWTNAKFFVHRCGKLLASGGL